jgi:hypothetical protein
MGDEGCVAVFTRFAPAPTPAPLPPPPPPPPPKAPKLLLLSPPPLLEELVAFTKYKLLGTIATSAVLVVAGEDQSTSILLLDNIFVPGHSTGPAVDQVPTNNFPLNSTK